MFAKHCGARPFLQLPVGHSANHIRYTQHSVFVASFASVVPFLSSCFASYFIFIFQTIEELLFIELYEIFILFFIHKETEEKRRYTTCLRA